MSNLSSFIKVLFLEANPETKTHLRINKEIREIKQILRKSRHHDRIEINQLGAVRTEDFTAELLNYKPRIVHFSGHGEESNPDLSQEKFEVASPRADHDFEQTANTSRGTSKTGKSKRKGSKKTNGGLIFEDEVFAQEQDGKNLTKLIHRIVPPSEVASFFRDLDTPVECVVLNGCHTQETAKKVNEYVRLVIGMNDEILDEDAVKFSKYFYQCLGAGSTIKFAFEEARKQVSDPSLPVWLENKKIRPLPHYEPRWIILSSFVSAFLIILFRIHGGLQGLEIGFFDYLQSSWSRDRDERVLIIHATQGDVRAQHQRGESVIGSFSNKTLGDLLEKINSFEPAAIGLDIYRENTLDATAEADGKLIGFLDQDNIFGICKRPLVEEGGADRQEDLTVSLSVPPSPYLTADNIGFSNFLLDRDTVVRRHVLGGFGGRVSNERDCIARESFNLKLTNYYLNAQNTDEIRLNSSSDQVCRVELPNGRALESLQPFTGGYQAETRIVSMCQVLLKYRIDHNNWQSAEMFSVQQVLDGQLADHDLNGKIVLVGVTRTDGYRDYWNTPYNVLMEDQMAGVMLHAQMISQLLDAALDQSPLIWVMPFWGEWLWILLWSSVGGIIVWKFQLPPLRIGALVIAVGTGYVICYVTFQAFYGWLPFVPVVLVLAANPLSNWVIDSSRLGLYKLRKYR